MMVSMRAVLALSLLQLVQSHSIQKFSDAGGVQIHFPQAQTDSRPRLSGSGKDLSESELFYTHMPQAQYDKVNRVIAPVRGRDFSADGTAANAHEPVSLHRQAGSKGTEGSFSAAQHTKMLDLAHAQSLDHQLDNTIREYQDGQHWLEQREAAGRPVENFPDNLGNAISDKWLDILGPRQQKRRDESKRVQEYLRQHPTTQIKDLPVDPRRKHILATLAGPPSPHASKTRARFALHRAQQDSRQTLKARQRYETGMYNSHNKLISQVKENELSPVDRTVVQWTKEIPRVVKQRHNQEGANLEREFANERTKFRRGSEAALSDSRKNELHMQPRKAKDFDFYPHFPKPTALQMRNGKNYLAPYGINNPLLPEYQNQGY